jgi:hypothetical protein
MIASTSRLAKAARCRSRTAAAGEAASPARTAEPVRTSKTTVTTLKQKNTGIENFLFFDGDRNLITRTEAGNFTIRSYRLRQRHEFVKYLTTNL